MSVIQANGHPETLSRLQIDGSKTDTAAIRLLIINLMPDKKAAEYQLMAILHQVPYTVSLTFAYINAPESTNPAYYTCQSYYDRASDSSAHEFDGLIVTGAPLEHLSFEAVHYSKELRMLLDRFQVIPYRLFICWGALFALHHSFSVQKKVLPTKLTGVYRYEVTAPHPLTAGLAPSYVIPQSRHATVDDKDLSELIILSRHDQLGADLITTPDSRDTFMLGHLEYETDTLKKEYIRDRQRYPHAKKPSHYFPDDNSDLQPVNQWAGHAEQFYTNWLRLIKDKTS
ncbi:homoserine O-acetyltransferase/O-succinyltransferase family protein [Macrococcus bovicus]|uniref:homoserine O-acetyltransferase/O-succinyltransferase family protein n=1 Tax=Macrococcus bovicus TaxID=69968 RepID=UPI0025A5D7DF|nr:homoserine O-succinyltransferase [Macrococcus bovicus]WJP98080.1 homoserine O-succinyltransferase [Macrococcus bovicus]